MDETNWNHGCKNKNKSNKVLHVFPAGSLFIRATVLVLMWYIGTSHGYSGWVIIPRPTFSARNLCWTVLFARLPAVYGKGGKNMLEKTAEPGSFGGWAWDVFFLIASAWERMKSYYHHWSFPNFDQISPDFGRFLGQLLEWIEVSMERWRSQRHMSVMWTKVGILRPFFFNKKRGVLSKGVGTIFQSFQWQTGQMEPIRSHDLGSGWEG